MTPVRRRIVADVAWLAIAAIGVWLLRRDVAGLDTIQIQIGRFVGGTAAMMVVPMYLINAGFEAIFGFAMGKVGLSPRQAGGSNAEPWVERLLELAFVALGVYTVALLAAIDLFVGIMALISLFVGTMLSGWSRLPMGRLMTGCGGLLAGVQILMIGFVLLLAYTQVPVGGDLGVGAVLAMLGPGLRFFITGGIAPAALARDARDGGLSQPGE